MRLCDLDEIKIQVKRQYEDCHGYSGNKKAIYREAILAVRSILHSAKTIDAVSVVRCRECKKKNKKKCPMTIVNFGRDGKEILVQNHVPDDFYCAAGERKEGADNR